MSGTRSTAHDELQCTPSRISARLASKKTKIHHGKPGCPCCVHEEIGAISPQKKRKREENESDADINSAQKQINEVDGRTAQRNKRKTSTLKTQQEKANSKVVTSNLAKSTTPQKTNPLKSRSTSRFVKVLTTQNSTTVGSEEDDFLSNNERGSEDTHIISTMMSLNESGQQQSSERDNEPSKKQIFQGITALLSQEIVSDLCNMNSTWREDLKTRHGVHLLDVQRSQTVVISNSLSDLESVETSLKMMIEESSNGSTSLCSYETDTSQTIEPVDVNDESLPIPEDGTSVLISDEQEIIEVVDASSGVPDDGKDDEPSSSDVQVVSLPEIEDRDEQEACAILMSLTNGTHIVKTSDVMELDDATGGKDDCAMTNDDMAAEESHENTQPSIVITIKSEPQNPPDEASLQKELDDLIQCVIENQVDPKDATVQIPTTRPSTRSKTEETKSNENMFPCNQCDDYEGTEQALRNHNKRHHPSILFGCEVCSKKFAIKRECIKHRITHCKETSQKDLLKLLASKTRLDDDEVLHINIDKVSENIARSSNATMKTNPEKATHSCPHCEYRGTKVGLMTHTRRYHPKVVYTCQVCGKCFGTRHELNSHKGTHLKKTKKEESEENQVEYTNIDFEIPENYKSIHKCDICGYQSTKSGVIQHKHRHHQEKNLECDLCKKKFARQCDIKAHRASHYDQDGKLRPIRKVLPDDDEEKEGEGQDKYSQYHTCDICGYRSTYFGIKTHKRRIHMEKRFQCDICLKKFIDDGSMKRHRKSHFTSSGELKPWIKPGGKDESPEEIQCPECPSKFQSQKALEVHVSRVHEKVKNFMCEFCLFKAHNKLEVEKHVARHHREHQFSCEDCGKTYAFERELKLHIKIKHTDQEHCKCDICHKEFNALRYLKVHMERHQGKFKCFCPVCEKGFMDKARMNEHIETHKAVEDRNAKFSCQECGKRFIRKSAMLQHLDGHLGNRKYKCDICGKAFTLSQTLSRHKKRHNENRPFPCTFQGCGKSFIDKTSFDCHTITHTGESKHKCPSCDKAFTQAATLRRHVCKANIQKIIADAENITAANVLTTEQPATDDPDGVALASILQSAMLNSGRIMQSAIVIKPEALEGMTQLAGQTIQIPEAGSDEVMVVVKEFDESVQFVEEEQSQMQQPDENEAETFMCSVCSALFVSWDDVQNHMQIHIEHEENLDSTLAIVTEDEDKDGEFVMVEEPIELVEATDSILVKDEMDGNLLQQNMS